MLTRFILSLLLVCGLASGVSAQSTTCAELAKKHLSTLDEHLDLDFNQMKCLKEAATRFCSKNKENPPANAQQKDNRIQTFRKAILECLDVRQQERVKNYYRNERDKKARRNLLDTFLQEFGDEVIILMKKA